MPGGSCLFISFNEEGVSDRPSGFYVKLFIPIMSGVTDEICMIAFKAQ
jgi:hypothetical protein